MVYPLLAVPTGKISEKDRSVKEKLLPEHLELFLRCWEINLELWPETFNDVSGGLRYSLIEKTILKTLLNTGVFLLLEKSGPARAVFGMTNHSRFGKNTFQVSNPGKLMSVIQRPFHASGMGRGIKMPFKKILLVKTPGKKRIRFCFRCNPHWSGGIAALGRGHR